MLVLAAIMFDSGLLLPRFLFLIVVDDALDAINHLRHIEVQNQTQLQTREPKIG